MTFFLISEVLKDSSEFNEVFNFNIDSYNQIEKAFVGGEITPNSNLEEILSFVSSNDKARFQSFISEYGIDISKIKVLIEEDRVKAKELFNVKQAEVLGYLSDMIFGKQVAPQLPSEYTKKRENNSPAINISEIDNNDPERTL